MCILALVGETEREEPTMSDTIRALTEAVRGRVITPSSDDDNLFHINQNIASANRS